MNNIKICCKIFYNKKTKQAHARQIFTGFCELAKNKFIQLSFHQDDWLKEHITQNLVLVEINNRFRVIFDVNDGWYWIHGDQEKNLNFLKQEVLPNCDYFFKRSYDSELAAKIGEEGRKIHPLGLNYDVTSPNNIMDNKLLSPKALIKHIIKSNASLSSIFKAEPNSRFYYQNFEALPIYDTNTKPGILFLTRLWDPDDPILLLETPENRILISDAIKAINNTRVELIKYCQSAFGERFIGGLFADQFSNKCHPELIAPSHVTKKSNFMSLVKTTPICVATTGLHNSIGWKFGEYVAASRAIISEPLNYSLPGDFKVDANYLEFKTVSEFKDKIEQLDGNPALINNMMHNNYLYYHSYVQPEMMVANALIYTLTNRL